MYENDKREFIGLNFLNTKVYMETQRFGFKAENWDVFFN